MGILDEAIRQHLELKRQHGADDAELAQLEDEAFGPPTRPGEPDFPDRSAEGTEQAPPPESSGEAEAPAAEPQVGEHPVVEPAEPEPQRAFFDQGVEAGEPRPAPEAAAEAEPMPEPEPEAASIPAEQTEQPVEPVEAEPEGIAEPEPAEEAPIESLETVEHRIDDVVIEGDTGEQTELVTGEEEVVEEEAIVVEYEEGEEGEEESGEDVLEETPEFLRDAPEDDELWFEQGEPKDFDF